jgi:hypothetical protein
MLGTRRLVPGQNPSPQAHSEFSDRLLVVWFINPLALGAGSFVESPMENLWTGNVWYVICFISVPLTKLFEWPDIILNRQNPVF